MDSDDTKEGSCSVCGKHATSKCSNCKLQFYCTKEHQREDWSRHKLICRAWEIHENAELGRHLLASRDLQPGDVIVSESPLVWGPALHVVQRVCVGCGKPCTNYSTRCTMCLWPACEMNCPGLTDKEKHGLECSLLVHAKLVPRCDVLLVIRMLILWRMKSKNWTALEKLQSHEEARGPGTKAFEEVMNISQHLERVLSGIPEARDLLGKICGWIDVNALETTPPEGSMAIYEIACLLEHSCLPNTRHSFALDKKGRPRITVTALSFIKKGDHLSTMYTHALWATTARRAHLLDTKYFSCHCKRCADPTEFGTHLGTLKCPQDNGYILPKDPLNLETDWECDVCSGILSYDEVADLTGKLEDEVDQVMHHPTRDALMGLLSRLTALLHPGHQHCITVSLSLVQLLSSSDPNKSELCRRIIKTTTTLDPHRARLALYTSVAMRELSTCPDEDTEGLLLEAFSLLELEPSNSPGEKLRNVIQPELSSC